MEYDGQRIGCEMRKINGSFRWLQQYKIYFSREHPADAAEDELHDASFRWVIISFNKLKIWRLM